MRSVTPDAAPARRTYRRWDEWDKNAVLKEGRRLLAAGHKERGLIKHAQLVLPAEKQRSMIPAGSGDYRWFWDGLKIQDKPEPIPEPAPLVEPEPPPPAYEVYNDDLGPIPLDNEPLPAPAVATVEPDPGDDEQEAWVPFAALPLLRSIVDTLKDTQAATSLLTTRLDAAASAPIVEAIRHQTAATEKVLAVVMRMATQVDEIENRVNRLSAPSHVPINGYQKPAQVKPRVVILGVDSGHWKGHIRQTAGVYCANLEFKDTTGHPHAWKVFDLVVVTKKVPAAYLAALKENNLVPPERLVIATGSADSIAQVVRNVAVEWKPKG